MEGRRLDGEARAQQEKRRKKKREVNYMKEGGRERKGNEREGREGKQSGLVWNVLDTAAV